MAFTFRKSEAAAIQNAYIAGLPERIEAIMRGAAVNGQTSVIVSYIPASDAQAASFKAAIEAAPFNWTVVQDTVAKTLTIS